MKRLFSALLALVAFAAMAPAPAMAAQPATVRLDYSTAATRLTSTTRSSAW
jgi:hypothetical protein